MSGSFTIEFLLDETSSANEMVFSTGVAGSGYKTYLQIIQSSNYVEFGIVNSAGTSIKSFSTTIARNLNQSYHWQITVDDTVKRIKIYLDSVLKYDSGNSFYTGTPTLLQSGWQLRVGGSINSYLVVGNLQEFRIWNAALPAFALLQWQNSRITSAHPNFANLICEYKMDENTGMTLTDSSSNGYNLTFGTGATWATGITIGNTPTSFMVNTGSFTGWTQRSGGMSAVWNNLLYLICGDTDHAGGTQVNTNQVFDPSTFILTTKTPAPTPRHGCYGGVVNGVIYVIGGFRSSSFLYGMTEAYTISSDTWATKTNKLTNCEQAAAAVVGNIIYCVGGYNASNALNILEAYNTTTDTWQTLTPPGFAWAGAAAVAINGKIYVTGGWDSDFQVVDKNMVYDPTTDTWSQTSITGLTPTQSPASFTVNGQSFVIGGNSGAYGTAVPANAVSSYSPIADAWQNLDLTGFVPVIGAFAGIINGVGYIVGGNLASSVYSGLQLYTPPDPLPAIPALSSPSISNT